MSNNEVLEALALAQARYPELRIGQLIDNALYLFKRALLLERKPDLFYVSDSELARALRESVSA